RLKPTATARCLVLDFEPVMVGFAVSQAQRVRREFEETFDRNSSVHRRQQRPARKLLEGRRVAVPESADDECRRLRHLRGAPENEMRLTTCQDAAHRGVASFYGL